MKNVVFICGATRSGTTLLSNLLDGHPNILMLPVEPRILHYWNLYKRLDNVESYFTRDYLTSTDVIYLTNEVARKEFNNFTLGQTGVDNFVKWDSIERSDFIERYLGVLNDEGVSLRTVYKAMFKAAMPPDQFDDENKLLVEKRPFDNEAGALQLHQAFPNAKFIHIIRDPRTRYLSVKMIRVRKRLGILTRQAARVNGKDFATGHAESTMASMELALLNKSVLGDKYYLIRFEDLLANPEEEMRKIADYLNVDFTKDLLKQTVGSQEQGAASSLERGMPSGIKDISNARLQKFYRHTSRAGQKILGLFTWELAKHFGCDIEPVEELTAGDFLAPLKYERPEDYFGYRIYMMLNLRNRKSFLIKSNHFQSIISDFYRGMQAAD